ncbi:putative quinol monooxygenase [Rosistilla oblonga]|uniref:Monooxygenase n=1 Tax=Rosistilla oblonga TaxID=2527990 RepID=A0A518J0V2_9BACT|nr:putative quinol monooxygenase [Rosistilla oblonga]QDV58970.1 Putative monooxygenase [Rosistilla oblonga]
MANLTIVAHIHAKADQIDFVKSELEKMVAPTRAEKGCVQYDLHQDHDHPTHFMFFENWESRELWQDHSNSQHVQAYRAASEGAVESFTLHEMTQIA